MRAGNVLVVLLALWMLGQSESVNGLIGGLMILALILWMLRGYWRLGGFLNRLLRRRNL